MNHTTTGIIIAAITAIMLIAATNVTLIIQERQAYAASLASSLKDSLRANLENKNQHLTQQGNCIRTGGCSNSDVGQGTPGNDNSVTGFADQSTLIQQQQTHRHLDQLYQKQELKATQELKDLRETKDQ
jgi:hypothetical protein